MSHSQLTDAIDAVQHPSAAYLHHLALHGNEFFATVEDAAVPEPNIKHKRPT